MRKLLNYFVPALLAILMFTSNFLQTDIFDLSTNNFAVWFVLSILCFACGWYINKTLGWHFGGKVVFAIIIALSFISVVMISFLREYFDAIQLLPENIILFSLRNITLGAMAIYGMAVAEVIMMQKEYTAMKEKLELYESATDKSHKEAELELKEAKLKAQKIIQDAELEAKNLILKKERIEKELKEFIQAEKELIKKYEEM